uniref:Replication initiator protein n=1 Tax=Dulem virus 77 TaxID=3145788 RepID=A0AAU8AYB0_9VIRU
MKCYHPIVLRNGRVCRCNKCFACLQTRIKDWSLKLQLEAKQYGKNCIFLTLTYDDYNLPKDGLLHKEDYQNFLKRLRKELYKKGIKIRYFCTGEYGEQFGRPHFHLIIYGIDISYYNLILEKWGKGFIYIKPVNHKNCKYVAKYCVKSYLKDKVDVNGEVFSEFITFSRKVGLGFGYFLNDELKSLELLCDGFVKIGNCNYSLPYSFIRKIRERFSFKKIHQFTIYCSGPLLKSLELYDFGDVSKYLYNSHFSEICSYDEFRFELKPLSYFLDDLEKNRVSCLNFCQSKKLDSSKYVMSQSSFLKYKNFLEENNFLLFY